MPLLILDRDGVINAESDDYVRSVDEWRPLPGSIEAVAALSRAGFRVVVATNQSGLGRGYFTREDLEAIHTLLCSRVEEAGGQVAGIFYCPHRPEEGCDCRKPADGLLRAIEAEFGEPVRGAWYVGDSMVDLQAAENAGCRPALVLTGRGADTLAALHSADCPLAAPGEVAVHRDLAAATRDILRPVRTI